MLEQREQELRKQYPAMFSHPQLKEGEVCLGIYLCDVAALNTRSYQVAGLTSARLGEGVINPSDGFQYDPIFASLREYLEVSHKHEQTQ